MYRDKRNITLGSAEFISGLSSTKTVAILDKCCADFEKFDTVFIIDSRSSDLDSWWQGTQRDLETLTSTFRDNKYNIETYYVSPESRKSHRNHIKANTFLRLFETIHPTGMTPIDRRIKEVLTVYLERYIDCHSIKPISIVIISIGAFSDVERTIVKMAEDFDKVRMPVSQVGIQFLQVGLGPSAGEHFCKLKSQLKPKDVGDMVDIIPWNKGLDARGILDAISEQYRRRRDISNQDYRHGDSFLRAYGIIQ